MPCLGTQGLYVLKKMEKRKRKKPFSFVDLSYFLLIDIILYSLLSRKTIGAREYLTVKHCCFSVLIVIL